MANIPSLLLQLACRSKSGGVVINYHKMTRQQVGEHTRLLARYFEFIPHEELLPRLNNPGRRPFCLLTFDDGKRIHSEEIADELSKLGIPAVFYVVTEFLNDQQTALWFDRYQSIARTLALDADCSAAVLKRLPHRLRVDRVNRLIAQHDLKVDWADEDRPMTWDAARRLSKAGHTIGSHSCWHSILPRESLEVAKADIRASIDCVKTQLGGDCPSFAFPNGNYTAELAQFAVECGVETVVTTEPTWCDVGVSPWRIPRIQLHPTQSESRATLKLALAATGNVLRNPDGTGRLYVRINRRVRHQ